MNFSCSHGIPFLRNRHNWCCILFLFFFSKNWWKQRMSKTHWIIISRARSLRWFCETKHQYEKYQRWPLTCCASITVRIKSVSNVFRTMSQHWNNCWIIVYHCVKFSYGSVKKKIMWITWDFAAKQTEIHKINDRLKNRVIGSNLWTFNENYYANDFVDIDINTSQKHVCAFFHFFFRSKIRDYEIDCYNFLIMAPWRTHLHHDHHHQQQHTYDDIFHPVINVSSF